MKQLTKYAIDSVVSIIVRGLHSTKIGRIIIDSLINNIRLRTYVVNENNINLVFYAPNSLNYFRAETLYKKEPETIDWIDSFSDSSFFWDIGSNIGLYSCYAAKKKNCKVIAFEPSPLNLELLSKNIFINKLVDKITIFSMPLSNAIKESKMKMSSTDLGGALSTFGEDYGHDGKNINSILEYNTFGFSGDEIIKFLNLPQPDHIKIDVDGIEHLILLGCNNLLKKTKSILIEVNDEFQEMSDQVREILNQNQFILKEKQRSEFVHDQSLFSETYNQIWLKRN